MKKIGILTYFSDQNPGTFLQAYSMLTAVANRFPDSRVEIIDYLFRRSMFHLRKGHLNLNRLVEEYVLYRRYKRIQQQFLVKSSTGIVSSDYDVVAEFIEKNNYDMVIVGGDTVLDIFHTFSIEGKLPTLIFWLPPRLKCKKVVFSASVNALTYDRLKETLRKMLSESIADFDLVGVRDEISYKLMESLGLKNSPKLAVTPDPTFTFDIDYSYVDKLLKARAISFKAPTLGISLSWKLPVCKQIIKYYKSKGFRVISLGYNKYADVCLVDLMPFEWAGIYKYFTLTITDRFHGTIFSLKNNTPVVTVDCSKGRFTPEGLSKTYCLLKLFNLEKTNHINVGKIRDFADVTAITDAAVKTFDCNMVEQTLITLRRNFNDFLDRTALLL